MVATSIAAQSDLLQSKTPPFKNLQNYRSFRPPRMQSKMKPSPPPLTKPASSPSKKSVTFAPYLQVRDLHRTRQDLKNSWYAAPEYVNFDRERRHTVAAWHHVRGNLSYLDPEIYTIHGLERHLDKHSSYQRKMVAKNHCYSVLETAKQGCDGDELRRVSEYYSKEVSHHAYLRGVLDSTMDIWYY